MLLTARQTADRLGVKLDTLYAYVSRGRLRSVMVPGSRERRYRSEDVEALLDIRSGTRQAPSTDPEAVMPAIGSSICLIENGRFYYRGQDAVRLSEGATLEEIARLLSTHRIKRVPVVRDCRIVGIVSRADLVRALVARPHIPAV